MRTVILIFSVSPSVAIGTDTTSVVKAEEALEIPPIIPLDLKTPLVTETDSTLGVGVEAFGKKSVDEEKRNDRRLIFQKIAEQEFEDVVFMPERKSKKSMNKSLNGNENGFSDTDESSHDFNKCNLDNEITKTTHSSLLTLSIDNDMIFKQDRNLDLIQKDVEDKEKLLADVLNFDLSEYMTGSRIYSTDSNISNSIATITYVSCNVNGNESSSDPKEDIEEQDELTDRTETESIEEEDVSYKTELKKLEDLGECSKMLLRSKLIELNGNNNVDIGVEPPTSKISTNTELQFNGKYKYCFV